MDMQANHDAVPTLESSAMILRYSISMYTGRKTDKKTRDEVVGAKGARAKSAASVYKSLFADDNDLQELVTYQGLIRRKVSDITLPWTDSGDRLVPTATFYDVSQVLNDMRDEFDRLADKFVSNYYAKVSNAAFALGGFFDRNEYPDPSTIRDKFRFVYTFEPVPRAGDFRVDLHNEAVDVLRQQYEQLAHDRLHGAMQDLWSRVLESAAHLRDKVAPIEEGGKRPRIHTSTIEAFRTLVDSLAGLNLTNDADLDQVRRELKSILEPMDVDTLRQSDSVRETVHKKMQDVLDKFAV